MSLRALTRNAAGRREELLASGLEKSHRRKILNIVAGILSLISAGAITAVLANIVGKNAVQVTAALVALFSGTISLVVTSYFSDDEIVNLFNGSSKYLGLRESVNRLAVSPTMTDPERFEELSRLQDAYAKLDETYSRYFTRMGDVVHGSRSPDPMRVQQAADAAQRELAEKFRSR